MGWRESERLWLYWLQLLPNLMDSAKTRIGASLGLRGVPRKLLEVPKSPWIKGASIPWPRLHLHLYIMKGNPIFQATHQKPRIFLLLAAAKEGEELLHCCTITKEEEGGPRAAAPEDRRSPRRGCCGPPPPLWAAPLHQPLHQVCSPWPCVSSFHRGWGLYR